jgi:predicted transcriptional regulator
MTDSNPTIKANFPARGSVSDRGIRCLIDGQVRVMLSRYVSAAFKLTEEEYRRLCDLPDDYPMTAGSYGEERLATAQATPGKSEPVEKPEIIRPIEGSVTDKLVHCLFDNHATGFPGHYVREKYRMTWSQYRAYCGLPADYHSVAPYYRGGA